MNRTIDLIILSAACTVSLDTTRASPQGEASSSIPQVLGSKCGISSEIESYIQVLCDAKDKSKGLYCFRCLWTLLTNNLKGDC